MNRTLEPRSLKTSLHSIEKQTEGMILEETPELLAAIDEGLRSAETEECIPIEVVKAALRKKWATL